MIDQEQTLREQAALDILQGCPPESLSDHQEIADAIKKGVSIDEILSSPQANRWPETYVWLKSLQAQF